MEESSSIDEFYRYLQSEQSESFESNNEETSNPSDIPSTPSSSDHDDDSRTEQYSIPSTVSSMSTPPTTTQVTLPNGIVIETTARTIEEALNLGGATYTRDQRAKLTADQKAKFVKSAIEPTFTKFSIIDFTKSQSDKFLEESFSFMTQVDALRRHLQLYGLLDVFQLSDMTIPNSPTIDILASYSTIDFKRIQEWSKLLYTYADQVTLENLQLSLVLLTNACDDELQAKLNGELSVMPVAHRSGPTAFMIIARNIVVTTEKTVRAFTYHLQRLKLSQMPGEDVGKFISIFKGAANRLNAAGHLPNDTRTLAYEGLRSGSVFQFRQILEVRWIMQSPTMDTWEGILDTAQNAYQELLAENQWVTKKKQGSTFPAINNNGVHNGNKATPNNSGNNKGGTVDRRAPKKGEPHTRINSMGKEEYWCGDCKGGGRWGNHPTPGHIKWYTNFKKTMADLKKKKKEQKEPGSTNTESSVALSPDSISKMHQPLRPTIRPSIYTSNPNSTVRIQDF